MNQSSSLLWSSHDGYEFKARLLPCFYDGATQSQISEKFVCPSASQNAVGHNRSNVRFSLVKIYTNYWPLFLFVRDRVFPLGWPTERFPKLIKTRIDKTRLSNLWVQTESNGFCLKNWNSNLEAYAVQWGTLNSPIIVPVLNHRLK